MECEPRWSKLALANLRHARAHGAAGTGLVLTADARSLPGPLTPRYEGQVGLVLTSPPYGSSVHGQVRTSPGRSGGVYKSDATYGHAPANLASQPLPGLQAGLARILAGCLPLLRPDAHVVITARPYRRRGELVHFPGTVIAAAYAAGLELAERLVAGLDGDRVIPRASFFQLDHVRRARAAGQPLRVIAHEDVLVFTRSPASVGSDEPRRPRVEPEPSRRAA